MRNKAHMIAKFAALFAATLLGIRASSIHDDGESSSQSSASSTHLNSQLNSPSSSKKKDSNEIIEVSTQLEIGKLWFGRGDYERSIVILKSVKKMDERTPEEEATSYYWISCAFAKMREGTKDEEQRNDYSKRGAKYFNKAAEINENNTFALTGDLTKLVPESVLSFVSKLKEQEQIKVCKKALKLNSDQGFRQKILALLNAKED